ncbi:MAG TPA: DUF2071 domain-containing protein [Ktedonobacterales bacterium]|nr:DUF2071 domain-containing protein [Ktedonobacterales bacterium]
MAISETLAFTHHRPWPLSRRPWLLAQTWKELLFAHWPVPASALRERLPHGLALDTFDGEAWVGVVPFRMSGVHFRGLPGFPTTETFPELNVRTYVVAEDKPGVYFFSLDAGSLLAVAGARTLFFLPYFPARFSVSRSGETISYNAQRSTGSVGGRPRAVFAAHYRPTGPVFRSRPGTLEHWLTERYRLYTAGPRGHALSADIHHMQWPLQPAEAEIERNTMALADGITLPETPPLLHYAQELHVAAWRIRRVNT